MLDRWCHCVPAALAVLVVLRAWSVEQPVPVDPVPAAPSRGEMLYATHCLDCHTAQIHWRARKLARNWPTLRAQVDRWQQLARLGWRAEDVDAVTRYLNESVYRFAAPVASMRAL